MDSVAIDKHAWTQSVKNSMGEHWEEFGQPLVALMSVFNLGFHSVKGLKGKERKEQMENNEGLTQLFKAIAKLYAGTKACKCLNEADIVMTTNNSPQVAPEDLD